MQNDVNSLCYVNMLNIHFILFLVHNLVLKVVSLKNNLSLNVSLNYLSMAQYVVWQWFINSLSMVQFSVWVTMYFRIINLT